MKNEIREAVDTITGIISDTAEQELAEVIVNSPRFMSLLNQMKGGAVSVATLRLAGEDNEAIDMLLDAGLFALRCATRRYAAQKMLQTLEVSESVTEACENAIQRASGQAAE